MDAKTVTSTRSAKILAILSFIPLVLTLIALAAALFVLFIDRAVKSDGIICGPEPALREVQQHGRYWVLRNFIAAEQACHHDLTLTLQGTYVDIYQLEDLYLQGKFGNGYFDVATSFAVYIPDAQHYNRTLSAIAYVRNCLIHKDRYVNCIREHVSFHLYFLFEHLHRLDAVSLLADVDQYSACEKSSQDDDGGPAPPLVSMDSIAENAVIVGRNIAQLAAQTRRVLGLDAQTYPNKLIFHNLVTETMFDKAFKDLDKTVLRLPLIIVRLLQRYDYLARMDKQELQRLIADMPDKYLLPQNDYSFLTQHWLQPDSGAELPMFSPLEVHAFADYRDQLLAQPSYFIGHNQLPLLAEHVTLSLGQSENLRIHVMQLQRYNFVVPTGIYVLHNVSGGVPHSWRPVQSISAEIWRQYEIVYGLVVKVESV